jgi:hypothetical protein
MLSLVPDALTEEAAYLAAAVREGSLTAPDLIARACDRAAPFMRVDRERALARAHKVEACRGAPLLLGGVPFVFDEVNEAWLEALSRVGAVPIGQVRAAAASMLVSNGGAAFAVLRDTPEFPDVHLLRAAGEVILARSSRDLALVRDALSAAPSLSVADALCRPFADSVGRAPSDLMVALIGAPAIAGLLSRVCRVTMFASAIARDGLLDRFDAVASEEALAVDAAVLRLPVGLDLESRTRETAIRIGAALDAEMLKGG